LLHNIIHSIICRFYEDHEDIDNARAIFEKAVLVPYRNVEDLASVWCAYSDMELRHDNYDEALAVMMRATTG
jgi:pre-mRNA-splicing factor SYF1